VKIDQAIGDKRYGDQNTDGSHSIRSFLTPCESAALRRAGFDWQRRRNSGTLLIGMLNRTACSGSQQRGGARVTVELVAGAARVAVPKKERFQLKKPSEWRFIGRNDQCRFRNLCTGKAMYGMDARLDEMVYASIERPPVFGGKVKAVDDQGSAESRGSAPERSASIRLNLRLRFSLWVGFAVIADNTWAAFQGRKKLKITWDNGPNESYDSAEYKKELRETAHKPGKVIRSVGDSDKAFRQRMWLKPTTTSRCWQHAAMEPMVALAGIQRWKVTAWAPTQNPQAVQQSCLLNSAFTSGRDLPCHLACGDWQKVSLTMWPRRRCYRRS